MAADSRPNIPSTILPFHQETKIGGFIDGATHGTFGGSAGEQFLRPIEELTTAFWDAYLKANAKERERLKSGTAWTGSGVRLESK